MSLPLSPVEARGRALAIRKALGSAETTRLSQLVVKRFLENSGECFASHLSGRGVALYKALPGELDLASLESALRGAGAKLLFPRVIRDAAELEFVEADADTVWETGPYGIREPHRDHPASDPTKIALIFVPGSAFGTQGERVGLGKGHYDRFLARVNQPIRIALAYDFQLFESIKTEAWDQPMDWIVTEKREIRLTRLEAQLKAYL